MPFQTKQVGIVLQSIILKGCVLVDLSQNEMLIVTNFGKAQILISKINI